MTWAFRSASTINAGSGAITWNAGDQLIIIGYDGSASGSTLSLSDTLGNTFPKRKSQNDTTNVGTWSEFDCLNPTTGATTLTLTGATGPGIRILRFTGLQSFDQAVVTYYTSTSASTDACSTTAITPGSYPAMALGLSLTSASSGVTAGTVFGSLVNSRTGGGFPNAEEIYVEALEVSSGSNTVAFTATAGNVMAVMGLTYIESVSIASPPLLGQILM